MALLFTVVLSACPSRISQSHNPLFIPTEAQSVCKWTWVMADKERITSPPIQTSHAASNTHLNTHARTLAQTIEEEREQMRKVFVFFFFSRDITPFFLCSPCVFMSCHLVKKAFMVFPGLMAMSVVRWIVGDLELLQEQHLVQGTREHLQTAFACKLGSPLLSDFLSSFCPLSTSISLQNGKAKEHKWHLPKSNN